MYRGDVVRVQPCHRRKKTMDRFILRLGAVLYLGDASQSPPCHGRGKDWGQACIQCWGQSYIGAMRHGRHPATGAKKIGDSLASNTGGSPILGRCVTVATLPRARKRLGTVLNPTLGAVLYLGDASQSPPCRGHGNDWGQSYIQYWGQSLSERCGMVSTLSRARKKLGMGLFLGRYLFINYLFCGLFNGILVSTTPWSLFNF